MTVSTTEDAGGSETLSFLSNNTDPNSTDKQFEILAIPYSHVDIAAGAYNPHNAYGTNDQGLDLQDVNVVAAHDTTEFWFVKLGVMYEVITIKGDEARLISILKTWQFN